MRNFVLYCKSYRGDLDRVRVLVKSVLDHRLDHTPLYISVPESDVPLFVKAFPNIDGVNIVSDESYCKTSLPPWKSQQVVKSSFWKLGVCKNYMVLDSDQYFIHSFLASDFIVPDTEYCYTVMHEQKELFGWTANKKQMLGFDPSESFRKDRLALMTTFGREKGRFYDFGPSPVLWNASVWEALEKQFLEPNGLTLEKVIDNIPSEFSIYGEFLLASKTIPIMPCEPLFKVFHYRQQFDEYKNNGYTEQDIAKTYMGICMQSNWGAPLKY